ncbi:response regulator transcription factor [Oryzomicrobium sp.]|uniref:response regulator transcription factor n=1 Tax=Oryzomicrobium sp. TaxID=1911578 RepID=UPI002FDF7223
MKRIIVVEDNADLLDEVVFHLRHQTGHQISGAGDARSLYALLDAEGADLVILDLGLPDEDGLEVARKLQQRPNLGLVMLTARGSLDDRVQGLLAGADNYLVKPVDMRELAAVVESVLRRLPFPTALAAGAWVLYPTRWQLRAPNGTLLPLTSSENRVLHALAEAGGETVSRQELVTAQGKTGLDFDFRHLESIVSRMRRKLDPHVPSGKSPLKAARGIGYAFIDPILIEG